MPLRILFLTHKFYPDIGGIETNSEILAHAFSEAGHEVHLLTWSKDTTGKTFPFLITRNPGKHKIIKEHAWADIVFENNPCLHLAWPRIFFKRPTVIALNTWISRSDGTIGIRDRLKLKWLKHARNIIAVSNAVRKRCWPNATVIGNPYQVNSFKIMPEIPRTIGFVFLGRLVSDKGADHAIHAIHRLITSSKEEMFFNANPLLTIIGDGPERTKLEQLRDNLGLNNYVHFTGFLRGEELVTFLNRHRFMLVPSIWEEPFGNVALEGMACGCIPIVSDCGGLPDAVGKAGLTFRCGDVDALVACIQKVLYKPALEYHLREASRHHLASFHPDIVSRQYLNIIETVAYKN